MLADMGADVIKVEKVPGGDDTRRSVPPSIGEESAAFLMMNRSKRGIALDLRQEAGKAVLRRLLADADVLVENYRRDTIEKLGFGYDAVSALNPAIIYCSISGFGSTGPYAGRGGFDLIAQAMSGIMSITGTGPGEPPVKCGPPLTDITAGLLAAMGILAALHHRTRTGEGQFVDTSLLEAGVMQTYWQSAMTLATGEAPGPLGSAHPLNAPYQAFETADGWIVVGGANQRAWQRLVEALGAPELAEDPRFRENRDRMSNLDALVAALQPHFRQPLERRTGWRGSRPPAFPPGRSTTLPRCTPIPRCWRATWWSRSSIVARAPSRRWGCRSSSPGLPAARGSAHRSTASTAARSSASTASPAPRSRR
jgi:crotonobetainyl-CoA:carnitine CoA-transferase CaiB-like acyl-CoA transferase